MINLLLGLVLTSAIGIADISSNDITEDDSIMLTSEVLADATNQDIINAINENTNVINAIVDAKSVSKDGIINKETTRFSGLFEFYLPNSCDVNFNINFNLGWNSNFYVFYSPTPIENFSQDLDLSQYSNITQLYNTYSSNFVINETFSCESGYFYFYIRYRTLSNDLPRFLNVTYHTLESYSMSEVGHIITDQQRQLDNITFCVVLLAFYPLLQDIIKKLGFRKELK